ncbi:MAG: Gfo/Idh/MocA family oxidoreductase [Chitinophagaceae bacterium]
MSANRRKFIKQLGGSALALTAGSFTNVDAKESIEKRILLSEKKYSPNDKIRIATIGMGIMGFNDTKTAHSVPGTEWVACCDLYDGRLQRAKELYGNDIFTTRHYEELLDRKDIDAILIATTDLWHSRISIDAMRKGKAVYCQKPMVHHIEQGWDVINAQKETKKVMQIGSQRVSSVAYAKAKELYKAGDIGQINSVEAFFDRQDALGAWEYTIPLDASPQTVDWERYQQIAPKKYDWDPKRFFWFRNYREYGTGVAGDLFVHLLSGLHFITDSKGPSKIYAIGGLTYWKDGRNVPDIMTAVIEYPDSKEHPAFQVSLHVNFVSGQGEKSVTKIVGSEGVFDISGEGESFTLHRHKMSKAPGYGGWDSFDTYPVAMQKKIVEEYNKKWSKEDQERPKLADISYSAPEGYDASYDHFVNFFESMRTGKPVVENPVFGFRAAAPCLACNESYFQNKVINWDAENMKMV